MPVDAELIRRKARLILEDLEHLRPVAAKTIEAYLEDPLNEVVTERLLERVIGRMVDINYHLCVETSGLPPRDYHDSFVQLASIGVLPRDRAESLARSSGLRNRLAHEYNGLDERLVHAAARTALAEVPEYLRAVEAFVSSAEA
jgi:uncharacterized protein YutE (UPF0331/DUF86 family)